MGEAPVESERSLLWRRPQERITLIVNAVLVRIVQSHSVRL
jgi:hypothetical protein